MLLPSYFYHLLPQKELSDMREINNIIAISDLLIDTNYHNNVKLNKTIFSSNYFFISLQTLRLKTQFLFGFFTSAVLVLRKRR